MNLAYLEAGLPRVQHDSHLNQGALQFAQLGLVDLERPGDFRLEAPQLGRLGYNRRHLPNRLLEPPNVGHVEIAFSSHGASSLFQ